MTDLSPETQTAIRQIEKLLKLAAKHPTEAEGISAANKAQELLTKYNLDMATVERGSDSGRREDAKMRGGLYHFQRDVWGAVAELNFCMYWNQYVYDKDKISVRRGRDWDGKPRTIRKQGGYNFVHRVVGRVVNTVATRVMAEYLLQAIERLARERYPEPSQFFTRAATSYREGIAERIVEKIYERRKHVLKEELRKQKEADKATTEAARKGVSTSTALTLSSYTQSEHDANNDFLHGEGWSAKKAAERAQWARECAEAEAARTVWVKAHPEEAAKQAEEARKSRRQSWGRSRQTYEDRKHAKRDQGAYYQGYDAGSKVSIEQQADQRKTAGRIG